MPAQRHARRFFEGLAHHATVWTGTSGAFVLAVLIVLLWVITGPIYNYSDTRQLVINTGTTIVTFLMVFLIQRTQNKDSLATQVKLNEILAALQGASNRLINVEDLSEEEIQELHHRFELLARRAQRAADATQPCSIETFTPAGH